MWDPKLNHFVPIAPSRWLIWKLISSLKAHYKLGWLHNPSSSSEKQSTMSLSVLRRSLGSLARAVPVLLSSMHLNLNAANFILLSNSSCWYQHLLEGTVSPGHVRTSPISVLVAFLNRSRQADVVCITIYLKLLIIDRETNRKSSTGSNVGLILWNHAKPGSDADDVPLLLVSHLALIPYSVLTIYIFWTRDPWIYLPRSYVIIRGFSMRGSLWPSLLILWAYKIHQ